MIVKFKPWWFLLSLAVLFLPISFIIYRVIHYTHGIFMYPFDDTFIHLTIADNLIKGNWGINKNEFASASSSILYTLILAIARMISKSVLVPFIVNAIAAITVIAVLNFWLRKQLLNNTARILVISFTILVTPLALLVVSGMEHTLQCLFSFLFIFYFSDWLNETKHLPKARIPFYLLLFAVLTASIRYEGLFQIAVACALLLAYKKIWNSALLAIVALLPVFIFGLISLGKGNFFLPNSVLVKSGSFTYYGLIGVIYDIVFDKLVFPRNGLASIATQRLLIVVPLCYYLFRKCWAGPYFFLLVFLFSLTVLQLSFASTGYLYRYEAYLFFCFTIIGGALFFKHKIYVLDILNSAVSKTVGLIIVFFLFFPPVLRSVSALDKTAKACINIYDQQYQMAQFTKKYFNRSNIAVNDIGATAYYTEANIIDLWGLANIEVTRSKKFHYWTPQFLDSLCKKKQVEFAMVYDVWFNQQLLKKWDKVATWQIKNNVICGDSVVSFYSLSGISRDILYKRLKEYESELPATVISKYY